MTKKKELYKGILGIDLGTTNSVITYWDGNKYIPIPSLEGEPIVPSAVHLREGKITIGERARQFMKTHPENTILSVKSFMDKPKHKFEIFGVATESADLPLYFSPVDIATNILKYIKKSAEEYIGEEIEDVVITVPAYFKETERQATRRAAEKGGLNVIEIINEPTAASLAYGYANHAGDEDKRVLVYDLGGGTFDVTLLEMSPTFYEVIATDGDKLGGDDLDMAFLEAIKKRVDIGKATEKQAKMIAEEVKKKLTFEDEVVADFAEYGGGNIKVTRNQFERAISDLVKQTIVKVETLLLEHGKNIDEVVLVGGSTKSPYIKKELIKLLNLPKDYFDKYTIDPDLAVSVGACIRGRIILGETDIIFMDITPFDLGIELGTGRMDALIHRGSVIPTVGSSNYCNEPGKSDLRFKIYQGNQILAVNNQYLGEINFQLDLSFIEIVNFSVEFDLDASGLLTVSVINLLTNERKVLKVTGVNE